MRRLIDLRTLKSFIEANLKMKTLLFENRFFREGIPNL